MSEYNNFSNFSFEPADESSGQHIRNSYSGGAQPPKKPKRMGLRIAVLALVCALVGGIGGAGAVGAAWYFSADDTPSAPQGQPITGISANTVSSGVIHVNTNEEGKGLTPADVYASYVEAVVGISAQTTSTNIFGQLSTAATAGTGFVLTGDGYIVTNNHVIKGVDADTIRVSMMDGTSYDAKIVGTEPDNDIALLKIEATGLKTIAIGNSDELIVGEQVCAIGNPLGELHDSLTVGYVSALDREINTDGTPLNMLQTDCAINPGNSGGPLFDMNGNVIGVTTAKYASDEIEGLGFAIPINDVMSIVMDLMNYGYVTGKAYMGISPVTISESYAYYYNMPVGVYIYSVVEGGAAEAAGLKQADIIIAIDETEITSYSDLSAALRDYRAGDTAVLTIWRSGEEQTLSITFDEKLPTQEDAQPQQPQAQQPSFGNPFGGIFGW